MNKAILRKSLLGIGVSAAALIFGAAGGDCGGPVGETPCSPETEATDCGADGDELCHPIDLVCVANCVIQGEEVCGGATPLCNDPDTRPVDDAAFNNMCVCGADTDCLEGEICDPDSHQCTEGEAGPCEVDGDCADPDNEVCVDGECLLLECTVDDDCFSPDGDLQGAGPGNELCDAATSQCEDPDVVEGNCPAADSFPTTREANGALTYDIDYSADADFNDFCNTLVPGTDGYFVIAFFHDEDGDMPITDAVANGDFDWAEDGSAVQDASDAPIWDGDGTDGNVSAVICFASPPASIGVQLIDGAGNASNVGCGDLQ